MSPGHTGANLRQPEAAPGGNGDLFPVGEVPDRDHPAKGNRRRRGDGR